MLDKRIAVVILNWNGAKLLVQYLPSVVAYSDEAKIYVVDNASTDNSIAVIKEKFPSVTIIQNDGNYGFAKGYNLSVESGLLLAAYASYMNELGSKEFFAATATDAELDDMFK